MVKKTKMLSILAAVIAATGMSAAARAEMACVNIEATVAYIDDRNNLLEGRIPAGSVVTGSYSYDTATPDSNSLAHVGDYWHNSGPYGITLQAGGFTFKSNPGNLRFLMEMINSTGDNYLLRSYNNIFDGIAVSASADTHISWQLDDPSSTALNSTALPAQPPVLSKWTSIFGLDISLDDYYGDGNLLIRSHVTSATPCPDVRDVLISQLQARIIDLEAYIAQLEIELEALTGHYGDLQAAYTSLQNDQNSLQLENAALATANSMLEAANSAQAAQIAAQQSQLLALETELASVDSSVAGLTSALASAFKDPAFSISGSSNDVVAKLINAILQLNNGQKQALYVNLGGSPGKKIVIF